jgi:RNA polymerase sigma factor (sigma-70 family)
LALAGNSGLNEAGGMKVTSELDLLTAADERRLARAIEAGVLAEHLLATGQRPVAATEAELRALVAEGRQCWQHFLLANLRLVWKLAGAEARRTGLSVEEFFQEGCVALAGALQRYDPDRGRFSTYALTRIRQHLVEAGAARFGELALPTSRAVRVRRALSLETRLGQQLGRPAKPGEVAEALARPTEWTRALLAHRRPISLDTCDQVWELADPGAVDPEWRLFCGQVRGLLASVPSDQAEVLRRRFGLDGGEPQSFNEVAKGLQVSASTVRRLERRGLALLRDVVRDDAPAGAALAG